MKAWEIVAYSFDGAFYCTECVKNPPECDCGDLDENGICANNCHGYGPNPVFASDELEPGDACDDCGALLGPELEETEGEA